MTNRGNGEGGGVMALGGVYPGHEERFALHLQVLVEEGQRPARALEALQRYYAGFEIYVRTEPNGTPKNVNELTEEDVERLLRFPRKQQDGRDITYQEANMEHDPGDMFVPFLRARKDALIEFAQELLEQSRLSDEDQGRLDLVNEAAEEYGALMRPVLDLRKQAAELRAKAEAAAKQGDGATETEALQEEIIILRSLKAYQEEHGDQLDELREVLEHRWTEFLGMVKAQGKWIPYLTEYSGILTGDYLKNVSEEHIESLMQDVKTKQQALSDFSEEFARTQFDKGPEEVSKKEFLEALRRPGNEEALERYLGLEAALRVALENEEYRLWVALEDEMVYKTNDRLNKRYYVNATREKLVGFAQSVTRGNEWPSELPAEFLNGIPADKQTEAVKLYQELCERFELSGVQDYLGEFEGEYSFEDEERMDQRERSYRNRDWIGFWRAVEKLYDSTHEKPASLPEMFVASSMKDGGVWKVLGYAHDVPDYWDIPDSFVQIGHQRYPTVFSLHPGGAHPFAELLDALIHNGDFATYVANVAHWMVYGRSPSFGTDTEAASIAYHILKHTLGYMPHIVFEALAPTTGLDLERLQRISPELAEQFEALAETHIAGSPDGPWFFIIGSEGWDEHGKPTYELTGVTDTSVLRPSVFTVWQFEDISIAMIGSEFQAMMEAAQQLYEDGVIPTPIPDNITIVRGGSVELKVVSEGTPGAYEIADGLFVRAADGGTRSFVIEESPTGKKDFVIKDKFGEIVLAVAPAADLEADIVVGQVPIEVAEFFNIKDLWTGIPSDIISFIQDRLPDWDYNTFRWVVLRLVELAQEDRNRTAVQRVLNELHDQLPYQQINAEEGPQKRRSSLAQVIREGLDRIFESVKSVAEEASREDQYRKVDFDTQTLMPEPEAFDQVLVIDAKGFPHEIDHDAWKDLQEEAAEAGWGEERLISEAAARLPASLSRMVVRAYRAGWRHLSITNLSGHRFIGTGVGPGSWELNIDLYGAPGQNLGTGSMGISFHPHAYYVQDDTFLNATGGYLAVPGSVGTTLGFAMQGATMVIGGDVHSRAFIQSTSRPGGQGYRVGILGRPYEFVGESLMGADLLMWMGLETDGNGGLTRRYYPYEGQDIAPGASLGNLLIYDPDDRLRAFHIEVNGQELILDRQQLESLDADNWPEALEGILSFEEWSSIQVVGIPAGTAGIREPLYLESVLLAEESLPLSLVGVLTSNQWQQIRAADEYQVGAWPVLSPREFLVLLTQESVEFALSPERLIRLWSDGPQYPMARRVPVDDTTWMEANRMFLLMNQEFGLRGEFVDKSGEVVPSRVWVGSEYELLRFAQTLVEEITSGRGPSDWPGQMERAVEDYAKALVGITDQTDDPEKIQAALAGPTQQLRKAFGFLIAPGVLDQLLVQNLDLQLSLLHQVHDSLQELLDVFDANGLDSYLTQVWHNPELREHYDYRGFWNLIHTLYSVGQPPLHSEARRCEVRVDGVWKELEASDLAGCESATGTSALLRFHLVVDGEAQILTKENFTQLRPMQGADRTKLKHRQAEAKKRANDYRVQDLRQRVEARDPVDMGDLFGEILKVDLPEVPPPPPVGALLRQQRELVAESLDQLGMLESAL
ncbi:MAG: hypothetical protein JW937_03860 [Candidatus Omnitrophica bacterium]|nr:hypothetical protein [Candidatus Omnitrophota bacterium]